MTRRAGAIPFAMAATSGSSPSSKDGLSGVTGPTGASVHSPSGIGSSARGRGGFGGPVGREFTPIHPSLGDSREIGRRDDRGRRRRSEAGRSRGMTVLPGVAELEGGVGLYDDDDDDDYEEEEAEEEEEEEEEMDIKEEEEEEAKWRSRKA